MLPAAQHDGLADDELVSRRLSEIAAAQALKGLRAAATRGDWGEVDRLLAEAQRQLAGNAWVAGVVASITSIATSRSRERLRKEAMYSSEKLVNRLGRSWSTCRPAGTWTTPTFRPTRVANRLRAKDSPQPGEPPCAPVDGDLPWRHQPGRPSTRRSHGCRTAFSPLFPHQKRIRHLVGGVSR
jgi:hypothetical protein